MTNHKEMTRYAFISHIEDYLKQLLKDPLHADTDEFLKYHGLNGPKVLSLLLQRSNPEDKNSAIIYKTIQIKNNGVDDNGKRLKDSFTVKYKIPRKDYMKKMRNLYINLFESNIIEDTILSEDGATNASCSGQFTAPLFGKPIKKTIYITKEQEEYLKKVIEEENIVNTQFGDFGYDAPISNGNNNYFFKSANDHKDIMKKSWPDEIK